MKFFTFAPANKNGSTKCALPKPVLLRLTVFFILLCAHLSSAQEISTFAGGGNGTGDAATNAILSGPFGVAADGSGNVYIVDQIASRVLKVNPTGVIITLAGNGTSGFSGDGGAATGASLNFPGGLAVDAAGNLYITDQANQRIRKVNLEGVITTVAGNGTESFSGDGGAAINAGLNSPYDVAVDGAGNLYIADPDNNRIRKVNPEGIITTVAGNGIAGFSGDGGLAINASISHPMGVEVDAAGNLYIADHGNQRVRKVNLEGVITTVAGTGAVGFSGDGGAAISASLNRPIGVAVDAAGNIYITEFSNHRVRKVDLVGIITTVAGNGTAGFSGDGGAAISASLSNPIGIAVDGSGNLYVADNGNGRIRKVSTSTVTSIVDEGDMGKALAYPNPARGHVFISTESEIKQVRLLNAFGTVVLTSQPKARQARLNLETLSAGVYTAVITAEGRVFTRRILLVK